MKTLHQKLYAVNVIHTSNVPSIHTSDLWYKSICFVDQNIIAKYEEIPKYMGKVKWIRHD